MNELLSEALQDFTGLLKQLLTNLLGNDADAWGTEFRKFLRKEPCWTNGDLKSREQAKSKPEQKHLQAAVVVDCDANPTIPPDRYLTGEGAEHRTMGKIALEKHDDGKLYVDGKQIFRYLSPKQQYGKTTEGHELRKELKDVQVLNACVMDALINNP